MPSHAPSSRLVRSRPLASLRCCYLTTGDSTSPPSLCLRWLLRCSLCTDCLRARTGLSRRPSPNRRPHTRMQCGRSGGGLPLACHSSSRLPAHAIQLTPSSSRLRHPASSRLPAHAFQLTATPPCNDPPATSPPPPASYPGSMAILAFPLLRAETTGKVPRCGCGPAEAARQSEQAYGRGRMHSRLHVFCRC